MFSNSEQNTLNFSLQLYGTCHSCSTIRAYAKFWAASSWLHFLSNWSQNDEALRSDFKAIGGWIAILAATCNKKELSQQNLAMYIFHDEIQFPRLF